MFELPLFAILLLVSGIILIIIEIFIPGFGAFGISGMVAVGAGIVISANSIEQAAMLLLITIIALTIIVTLLIRFIIKKKVKLPVVLYETLTEDVSELDIYIGKTGVAKTKLRPAGKADIEGITLDVMSTGLFINKGAKVRVDKIDGNKILVKEI